MGYTLVAEPSEEFKEQLGKLLPGTSNIPFSKDCDREEANRNLPYHVTLFHWAKQYDEQYLQSAEKITFLPFEFTVTGTEIWGGDLLCFRMEPGEGCLRAVKAIETTMGTRIETSFLHMTLAVEQDPGKLTEWKNRIDENFSYPFSLKINELGLYHIWRPVYKKSEYTARSELY